MVVRHSVTDGEILSDIHTIYGKDRYRIGGVVLIAGRHNLKSYLVPKVYTDCDMIWV